MVATESKIRFTANDTDYEYEVIRCDAITDYQNIEWLLVQASEDVVSLSDLWALKYNTAGRVEYYERTIITSDDSTDTGEWELKSIFENYNSGEIKESYEDSIYTVQIKRIGALDIQAMQTRADVDYIALMEGIEL